MTDSTKTTKTAVKVQPTEEKKTRAPRVPRDKFIVTRPHPKFDGLHQAFTGSNWVLIEMTKGWELNAPSIDAKTAQIAMALIGSDEGVKFIKATQGKKGGFLGDLLTGIDAVVDAVDAIDTVIDSVS